MRLAVLIALLLHQIAALAQQSSAIINLQKHAFDSLHTELNHAANDTMKMKVYRKLAFFYMETNSDSSLFYRAKQLAISEDLGLKLWEAHSLDYMGVSSFYTGNYPRALSYLLKAQKIFEDPASEKSASKIFSTPPALTRLQGLASVHHHLGMVYGATDNADEVIRQFKLSIKFSEQAKDMFRMSLVNMDLGKLYNDRGILDSALSCELQAYDYGNQASIKNYQGEISKELGLIYFKLGDYARAKESFTRSITESELRNNLRTIASSYVGLANLFLKAGQLDSALFYGRKSQATYKAIHSPEGLLNSYLSLTAVFKQRGNTDSALNYLEYAMTARDSLNNAEKLRQFQNISFNEQLKLREEQEQRTKARNRTRVFLLLSAIAVVALIALLLFRNSRNRKKANLVLVKQKQEIEVQKENVEQALSQLKATQLQLIQSEKMASLGQLTAGIAHEIQNPLNFVNNFSEINTELIDELESELKSGNSGEALKVVSTIRENEIKITEHGKRADSIVKNMLQHSRSASRNKESSDINDLADEFLRLAYHGWRAKDKNFNVKIDTNYDSSIPKTEMVPQDIGRVIINICNNAFYAISEKKKIEADGYEPTISLSTSKRAGYINLTISDNGMGIPGDIVNRIFQPFFTTKPAGQGTGLGLSLSYDILKAHGGEMKVETKKNEGSSFILTLPIT